jgi:hypothetical protein
MAARARGSRKASASRGGGSVMPLYSREYPIFFLHFLKIKYTSKFLHIYIWCWP